MIRMEILKYMNQNQIYYPLQIDNINEIIKLFHFKIYNHLKTKKNILSNYQLMKKKN